MSALWYRGAERLPADLALAIIPSLPRAQLERLAQQIIDHLDDDDGDTDLEGEHSEDELSTGWFMVNTNDGPGCIISDSDFSVDDQPCDDLTEDMEREVPFIPVYGEDQSAGSIGWKL